jgi:hypothetical protein
MAQQINLFNPILLTPRRYFSALAIVESLAVFLLALVALCGWSVWRTQAMRQDLGTASVGHEAERQRLNTALALLDALPEDLPALQQQFATVQLELAERVRRRAELGGGAGNPAPAAALLRLAQSVPSPVWLTDIRWSQSGLELGGMTLDPAALQPWLQVLSQGAAGPGMALGRLQVEHSPGTAPGGAEAWSFQITHGAASPQEPR